MAGEESGVRYTREFVDSINSLAIGFMEEMQRDMEMFARHARRSTVQVDDVKLVHNLSIHDLCMKKC